MMDSQTIFLLLLQQGYPLVVSFDTGAKLLNYPTVGSAYTAYNRGKFPVPVKTNGARLSVTIADLAAYLAGESPQSHSVQQTVPRRGRGRPSKAETIARLRQVAATKPQSGGNDHER